MSAASSVEEGPPVPAMNGSAQSARYRDLPYRSSNEPLKAHSNFAVKLSEIGKSSPDLWLHAYALILACCVVNKQCSWNFSAAAAHIVAGPLVCVSVATMSGQ